MVDPQRLRVFRSVVQTGSINRAAERLGYTPSAVSQHVAALQRETGLVLVERHGRGIRPTAAGVAVAEHATRVLDQLADFESLADDLRTGRSGTLRIGCFMSANRAWMPGVVANLTDEFPSLRIELSLVELRGQRSTDADLELYIAEAVRGDRDPAAADGAADGYDLEPLRTEGYVTVVPDGHPLAARTSVAIADLAGEPWVDNDHARGPCREIVLTACTARGFSPRFRIAAPDYATAFDYVAQGIGVTVLPRLGVHLLPSGVTAVSLADDDVRRRIMLRVKRSMRTNPAAQRAAELLRAAAGAG
ncbi:LysR family transcriptional regulator [Agromyces mariniharenae]|uniref:LysR family transcriptional regulator n=1 Tax=Agromyces mariniharenae TaxID=2604423 RepID=A0A5S4UVC4_9MICO|nr:LysR family transcriptional regulator [Agromyces mariniharenae]TYL50526.1 LysR family transcriptional regulator [Agromyces mariniharenae]